ncbi:MAG: nuclear transport factor 2 family protein [Gaiellaceae bacterium]
MTAEVETRARVEELYDAYAAGDLERMLGLMANDVVVTFLGQGTFRGLPAFRRFIDFSEGLLEDLDRRLDHVVVDGDVGCGIWSETARTADGHPWATTGVDVVRVRDGKIVSLTMNNDAALAQRHFPPYVDAGG